MNEIDWLAERFQTHRGHLQAVAYRMLGSLSSTWLSSIVSGICLANVSLLMSCRSFRYLPRPAWEMAY
jgi:hypothetical protein